jgi:hypothetical protein
MRQLTIERAAAIIIFTLLFAMATRIPVDTDMWWHLRAGEYTLTHGMIYADPFSFTRLGVEWTNHSWGAQIILYGIWKVFGSLGLAIYTAGLATAGMWFVYRTCSGNVYLRAFALVIGAATAAVFWSPRPQMISFFLSTVILYLLYLQKQKKIDHLWLIPPIMLVWGNLHAGFAIGFLFLMGAMAGETLENIFNPTREDLVPWTGIRKLALVTGVSVAAICVNPYGLKMLAVPIQTISIGALQNFIQEWNSPNFHERQVWPFAFLILGLFGAAGASKKRLGWTDFILSSGTAFLGLVAGRNIAVFAVVATPVLTHHVNDILVERGWNLRPVQRVTPSQARFNMVLIGAIMLAAGAKVALVLDAKTIEETQRENLPVAVTEYLKTAHLSGRMFNSYNWGGYLLFNLPDQAVFADGRTDLYGDEFLTHDYVQTAVGAPGWRETLDRYQISFVVMEANSGLARYLRSEPGWKLNYEDEQAAVFVRETANG